MGINLVSLFLIITCTVYNIFLEKATTENASEAEKHFGGGIFY